MKILFIPLDFQDWSKAKHLTYFFSLGFEEGFAAHKIEYMTIPTLCIDSAGTGNAIENDLWLKKARTLCAGKTFDQVWVEIVHNPLSEDILQWISTIAPIRLALIGESLLYEPTVNLANPHLAMRKQMVESRLRYFTHGIVVDEVDAADLSQRGIIDTFWYPSAVPEKFLAANPVSKPEKLASFSGAIYGKRGVILNDSRFKGIFFNRPSLDDAAGITQQFNTLQKTFANYVDSEQSVSLQTLELYLAPLREIRRESFRLWLYHLSNCSVVVNLPSYYQGYAGRVAEGICAGRPVISWDVLNRPRNRSLFIENEEILLFQSDDLEELHGKITFLLHDRVRAQELAGKALRRMWRFHTMEKRIGQILAWQEHGREPNFGEEDSNHSIASTWRNFDEAMSRSDSNTISTRSPESDETRIAGLENQLLADPDNYRLHLEIGQLFLKVGQYNFAINSFFTSTKLNPENIEAWIACAQAAIKAKNGLIARIAFEAAVELNPNFEHAHKIELDLKNL